VEVLEDGTELHFASICLADAELRLTGTDDLAFEVLKAKYADVLGGAPQACPRTAAWRSSSRRATRQCRCHAR
jgi:hypothetical protein